MDTSSSSHWRYKMISAKYIVCMLALGLCASVLVARSALTPGHVKEKLERNRREATLHAKGYMHRTVNIDDSSEPVHLTQIYDPLKCETTPRPNGDNDAEHSRRKRSAQTHNENSEAELKKKYYTVTTVIKPAAELPVKYMPALGRSLGSSLTNYKSSSRPAAKCPLESGTTSLCACLNMAKGILVRCDSLKNRNEFTNSFRDLREYVIYDTQLIGMNFDIENTDFDGMQVIMLRFTNSELRIHGDNGTFSFASMITTKAELKSIQFTDSSVNLGETNLRGLQLKVLEFYESSFVDYNSAWFKDVEVEQVKVSYSEDIKQPIARDMIGVQEYSHTSCGLTNITGMLPTNKSSLVRIDFSDNEITSLPDHIFDDMPLIEEIFLKGNQIINLPQDAFVHVWSQVKKLYIEDNPLLCDDVEWLRQKPEGSDGPVVEGSCADKNGNQLPF